MKKYIIIACIDDEITKPGVFSDKREAYKFYANSLLNEIEIYLDDKEYKKYANSFDGSVEEIKNNIKNMMDTVIENNDNIYENRNGYIVKYTGGQHIWTILEIE